MNEPAAAPAFDTLKEARTLTDAGVDEGTAEEIVAFTGRAMSNLATKADLAHELRGEIGKARDELRAEIGKARDELRAEIGRFDTKLENTRDELRGEIGKARDELRADIGRLDTKLDNMNAVMGEMHATMGKENWKFLILIITIVGAVVGAVFAVVKMLP